MTERFVLAAQLSTGHSSPDRLTKDRVLPILRQAVGVAPLDILITGWIEMPDLFRALTDRKTRCADEVYLWYPLLSDYPGLEPDHLVLNYEGVPSQGWGEFVAGGEINETFRFACPNNPDVRRTTLVHLERLLMSYDFDGVFLDKFRFPSPVNGLDEMLSCFCEHCYRAADERGLDLDEVRETLRGLAKSAGPAACDAAATSDDWLKDLLTGWPVLQEFVRFRCDSITRLVELVHALTNRLGKKLSFDMFSPGLSRLVGQEYAAIAPYSAWIKPMIYRFAKGPAGLRLELPTLAGDLQRFLEYDPDAALLWVQQRVPDLAGVDLDCIDREGVPLGLIASEARRAVELAAPVPIYLGLETVSMPGIIEITPENIKDVVERGRAVGVKGVVMSWDLLHTPFENLWPLAAMV